MRDHSSDLTQAFRNIQAQDHAVFNMTYFPYVLRLGRAVSYAIASYLLLWLQPHYSFNFAAFALSIFFLSLGRRVLPIAEVAMLMILAAVFMPTRTLDAVLGLL